MNPRHLLAPWLLMLTVVTLLPAQEAVLPPLAKQPLLRLEAGGPTSFVTALAFSPDGTVLYGAGWDKVVRVWKLKGSQFVLEPSAFRVPIGPGLDGAINALALSPDGTWLAAAGLAPSRGGAGFQPGLVWPTDGSLTTAMLRDRGLIYVFNTQDPSRPVRLLRGHQGAVLSLTFAPSAGDQGPLLVSVAREWNAEKGKSVGAVRLWDVQAETMLAGDRDLPDPFLHGPSRPGLTSWRTGPAPRQLRVALCWGDGIFRVWDAHRRDGDRVWESKDGRHTLSAVHLPLTTNPPQVLMACGGSGTAQFKLWDVPTGQGPKAAVIPAQAERIDCNPLALTLVSSRANGQADLAAVIERMREDADRYCLQLIRPGQGKWNTPVQAPLDIWKGRANQPVMAASLHGRYLAIGGNADHDILVYPIAHLLDPKVTPRPQVLRSAGTRMTYVHFLRRGADLGLLLNDRTRKVREQAPRAPQGTDLVFDFARRELTDNGKDWKPEVVNVGRWEVTAAGLDNDRPVLAVHEATQPRGRIVLREKEVISDWVLAPARPPLGVPVLVVASHWQGQPQLAVYNAATGQRLRRYSGHVDRISCLAVTADGRRLASVAEDQTICLWDLATLDQVVGKFGALPDVVVKAGKNGLEVTQVAADGPADGLRLGDVIEAVLRNGQPQPPGTPLEFYETVAKHDPGSKLTLRVRRQAASSDRTLVVGQGTDDRKPLFTLFITRAANAADRDWIGWTPSGLFESNNRQAERHLGWHFNTGERDAPTRFNLTPQHRARFYRRDLLKNLVAGAGVPPEQLADPKVRLDVKEGNRYLDPDNFDQYLLRQPRATLELQIDDRPLDNLEAVSWQLDNGTLQKLDLAQDKPEFSIPVPALTRGIHTFRLVVRMPDTKPAEQVHELKLRYQPPAPQVKGAAGPRHFIVRDPDFTLNAQVLPGLAGEPVEVGIVHRHKDQALLTEKKLQTIDPSKPLALAKAIKLQLGRNLVEVTAVNQKALSRFEELETAEPLSLEIDYVERVRPPLIVLKEVEVVGADEAVRPLTIHPGKPVVTYHPRVRITGTIQATENLARAEWRKDQAAQAVPLTGFKPDKTAGIREELTLHADAQVFRVRARTVSGVETEQTVTLEYRPPVPAVSVHAPAQPQLFGEADVGEARLTATVDSSGPRHPFEVAIRVNEQEVPYAGKLDEATGTLTARVPVQPGSNRIQVRLSNRWQNERIAQAVQVVYSRPPHILTLDGPRQTTTPLADLVVEARSPLPLDWVEVRVNGVKARRVQAALPRTPRDGRTYVVPLKGIALSPNENRIEVELGNQEGSCREPGRWTIHYRAPQPPPVVKILQPGQGQEGTAATSGLRVRFVVQSASRLKRVELIHEGQPARTVEIAQQRPRPGGGFELDANLEVRLLPGVNRMYVEAHNEGGPVREKLPRISYQPRPVMVEVDSLTPKTTGGMPSVKRGPGMFTELPTGQVRLKGRVVFEGNEQAAQLKKMLHVHIYVNGFQQPPQLLKLPVGDSRSREFQADLLLSQAEDNLIRVAVPALGADADHRCEFKVNCRAPSTRQRLHLLVISLKKQPKETLRYQVLETFQARPAGRDEDERDLYRSRTFDRIYVHGILVGDTVHPKLIEAQLYRIKLFIRDLATRAVPANDVVVLYYQGDEMMLDNDHYIAIGKRGDPRRPLTPCKDLIRLLADTPGAHLMLLDVKSTPPTPDHPRDVIRRLPAQFPDEHSHVAILRYAWMAAADAPRAAHLIDALKQSFDRALLLEDVSHQVAAVARDLAGPMKQLVYTRQVDGPLTRLAIGQPRQ